MQQVLPLGLSSNLVEIHFCLKKAFGKPPDCVRLDPVSQLVLTMVSARTREEIAKRAFLRLARHYAPWERLAHAPTESVWRIIRVVTFSERKSYFLTFAMQKIILLRGQLSLDFLNTWPASSALEWLETLPGVGPKTSAAVLNFSPLHKPVLVVDTAHWRAARRLGLIAFNTPLSQAAKQLALQLPEDWTADDIEDHHALMKQLGQTCCSHAHPDCNNCPVRPLCAFHILKNSQRMTSNGHLRC